MTSSNEGIVVTEPGTRIGRWTVLRRAVPGQRRGRMRARVLCQCECGVERLVFVEDLRAGDTSGCPSVRCRTQHEALRKAEAHVMGLLESDLAGLVDELRAGLREAVRSVIARRALEGMADGRVDHPAQSTGSSGHAS